MITAINTEEEYQVAMKRIDERIALYPFKNAADEKELDRLGELVSNYEDIHCPIDAPDASAESVE